MMSKLQKTDKRYSAHPHFEYFINFGYDMNYWPKIRWCEKQWGDGVYFSKRIRKRNMVFGNKVWGYEIGGNLYFKNELHASLFLMAN